MRRRDDRRDFLSSRDDFLAAENFAYVGGSKHENFIAVINSHVKNDFLHQLPCKLTQTQIIYLAKKSNKFGEKITLTSVVFPTACSF